MHIGFLIFINLFTLALMTLFWFFNRKLLINSFKMLLSVYAALVIGAFVTPWFGALMFYVTLGLLFSSKK